MAPKRASPLDDPPTASLEAEGEVSSEEEDTSSEEEEDDDESVKPPSTLPPPAAEKTPSSEKLPPSATKSQSQASSSESGTESDSGSNSEDERSTGSAGSKVKPIVSKPMEETTKAKKPKAKKPKPQPSATPARSATKRPSEKNQPVSDSKRAKKGTDATKDDKIPTAEDEVKKSGDDSKKLFQRVWSEDDEIAILKGMVEYSAKTGANPSKDMNAFHDSIKKSLNGDFSRSQLMDKIRRLKKKYENNAGRSKNGKDPSFSKEQDKKAFELSKKIWATEGDNGKDGKIDQNAGSSLCLREMIGFDKRMDLSGFVEDAVKRGFELIEASKRAELEKRWKKMQVAELELLVKRAKLIEDQSRLIWETYKSSESSDN